MLFQWAMLMAVVKPMQREARRPGRGEAGRSRGYWYREEKGKGYAEKWGRGITQGHKNKSSHM
jgi:hypothetical protein